MKQTHTKGHRRGFTMTELLVALFLASIGMMTVFGMQLAANLVQRNARDINAARMLGESFLTRLRGESLQWTNADFTQDCTQSNMPLCWWALRSPRGGQGVWVPVPRAGWGNGSPRHNALGIPDDAGDPRVVTERVQLNSANQRYCIHYSMMPVGTTVAPGELIRTEVRVYWPTTNDAFGPAGVSDCGFSDMGLMDAAAARGQFRYIQLNSVIYRHEDML